MAQFDVHENVGQLREAMPYLLVVQSAQFDRHWRRLVVPLARMATTGPPALAVLNPVLKVRGKSFLLNPLDLGSVPVASLGPKVSSLVGEGDRIIAALDEVFSRAWG